VNQVIPSKTNLVRCNTASPNAIDESMSAQVKKRKYDKNPASGWDAFLQLRDGSLYGTLVHMIKETKRRFPSCKSFRPPNALVVELWDELSSNPDEIPVTEKQLNELDRRFEVSKNIGKILIKSSLGRCESKDPFRSALMEVVLLLSAERDL
jgi:hypothetical protein